MSILTTLKHIRFVLIRKEKTGLIGLFLGMLLSSFLELFGLAVLTPVVEVVAYPEKISESSWLLRVFADLFWTNREDSKQFLIALVIFISCVYIFKALFAIFFQLWQQRFLNRLSRRLSVSLFSNYLYQPYEFHTNNNTSSLISKATYDVGNFVNALGDLLGLCSDFLFCFAVLVFLLTQAPLLTAIVFVGLGLLAVFLYWLFKKKAAKYGRMAAEVNEKKLKNIREGLAGIKETKISNREEHFVQSYFNTMYESQRIAIKQSVIYVIPRHALETVGMLGLLVALLIYSMANTEPSKLVSTFATLGIGVIKLLPYISRIMGRLNGVKGMQFSVRRVYNDMRLVREIPAGAATEPFDSMPFNNRIELSNIMFKYQSGSEPVLRHVSAIVPKGATIAFCGRSGAGKTTTVDILLGLLKPLEGNVFCDGVDVETNLRGWHANLSYVPQEIYLIDDTIAANVAFGCDVIDEQRVHEALAKAHLDGFIGELPQGIHTIVGEKGVRLSGGQRQRIGIARALYRNTPIIVFDEATSALDFETERGILDTITELRGEKTLIIITHRLGTIANCDYIYKIEGADALLIQYPGHPAEGLK